MKQLELKTLQHQGPEPTVIVANAQAALDPWERPGRMRSCIQMPEMDGLAAAINARERANGRPRTRSSR